MESIALAKLTWDRGNDRLQAASHYGTIQDPDGAQVLLFVIRPIAGDRTGFRISSELHRILRRHDDASTLHDSVEEAKFAAEELLRQAVVLLLGPGADDLIERNVRQAAADASAPEAVKERKPRKQKVVEDPPPVVEPTATAAGSFFE